MKKSRYLLSVRKVLVTSIVLLLAVTVTTILVSSFLTTQRVLRGHMQEIISYVAAEAVDHTEDFLLPAQTAADLTRRLTDNDLFSSGDMATVELQFYEHLNLFPQFAGIYFGWEDGEFVFVKRDESQTSDGFLTKIITREANIRKTQLIWRDADFKELKREFDPADIYDPRQRPWYIKAMDQRSLVWTDPYVFFTARLPGITTAAPVTNEVGRLSGVVGVDIEIGAISDFLSELRIGKTGQAMIVSRSGDVIAYPDSGEVVRQSKTDSNTLRFAKINEIPDPVAIELFNSMETPLEDLPMLEPVFKAFTVGGEVHQSIIVPFPSAIWPWLIVIHMPENDYLGTIKDNRLFNIGLAAAIGLVAILIGLVIARQISRPMAELRERARRIEQGDFDVEPPSRSPFKEVRATQAAFAQMIGGLREQQAQNAVLTSALSRAKVDLEQSVEKRTQELRDEITERRRAEHANSAKTRFLANMSHELRTPLNAIVGFSEIIKTQAFGAIANQRYVSYGNDIHDAGHHLRALIEDMIDLALVEGEKLPLNEEPLDPRISAEESLRMVGPMAEKKNIALHLDVGRTSVMLKADAVRIRQILINLLTNAIKYTPKGGEVWVSADAADDGGFQFAVRDNGVGLSQDYHELTVSMYAKRERRPRRAEDSYGLGLPLTAKLVEAHGGTFSLVSSPSRGTTAIAHLPPSRVISREIRVVENGKISGPVAARG